MSIGIADVYTSSVQDDVIGSRADSSGARSRDQLPDTANIYGDFEIKVGKALRTKSRVVLATKFGIVMGSDMQNRGVDGSPDATCAPRPAMSPSGARSKILISTICTVPTRRFHFRRDRGRHGRSW